MNACARCPHARHGDRCWEVVDKAGQKMLCPCSEFWAYTDLDSLDVERDAGDGGLGSRRAVERWEWEEERHLERTRG